MRFAHLNGEHQKKVPIQLSSIYRKFKHEHSNQSSPYLYPPDMALLATETVLEQAEQLADELAEAA